MLVILNSENSSASAIRKRRFGSVGSEIGSAVGEGVEKKMGIVDACFGLGALYVPPAVPRPLCHELPKVTLPGSVLCLYQWFYVAKLYMTKFIEAELVTGYHKVVNPDK